MRTSAPCPPLPTDPAALLGQPHAQAVVRRQRAKPRLHDGISRIGTNVHRLEQRASQHRSILVKLIHAMTDPCAACSDPLTGVVHMREASAHTWRGSPSTALRCTQSHQGTPSRGWAPLETLLCSWRLQGLLWQVIDVRHVDALCRMGGTPSAVSRGDARQRRRARARCTA